MAERRANGAHRCQTDEDSSGLSRKINSMVLPDSPVPET